MLLRPWEASDVGLVQEASLDPEVARMMAIRTGCGPRGASSWLARRVAAEESLVIVAEDAVGEVGAVLDSQGYSGVLYYWVVARARRRGLATEAVEQFCSLVELPVLTAYVSERNLASCRVLERCGFLAGRPASSMPATPDGGIHGLIFALQTRGEASNRTA